MGIGSNGLLKQIRFSSSLFEQNNQIISNYIYIFNRETSGDGYIIIYIDWVKLTAIGLLCYSSLW